MLRRANEQLVLTALEAQARAGAEAAEAEKARALFESLPDVIARFDAQLRWVYVNQSLERLCGVPRARLIGKTNAELGAPAALVEAGDALLADAFATGARGESFVELEVGGRRVFHVRTVPELGADGSVTSVVAIGRDVTESQQYRQAREDADRLSRLQSMTAAFSEARTPPEVADVLLAQGLDALGADAGVVMLLDPTEQTLELAGSAGCLPEEAARWRALPMQADAPVSEAVRTGEPLFFETAGAVLDRYPALRDLANADDHALVAVPLCYQGRPLGGLALVFRRARRFDDDDRGFVMALAGHSAQAIDRARAVEAERRARHEAETASRLKDEFLATVSHELRTPLNALLGWSTLLQTRLGDAEILQRGLSSIERNARAQARLVEDLLDISRIISGKLSLEIESTDVGSAVYAAVDVVRAAADAKRIAIRVVLDDVHVIPADPGRVQQMIWNLLSNAVKFTPEGGHIDVAVVQRGPSVAVEVRDSGRGIERAFLPHVFERFRQHDGSITRKHGGLGLGLAIVRQLAELHGGTATAASDGPGEGSCFTVELPSRAIADESASSRRDSMLAGTSSLVLQGLVVLVVDDDEDARELESAMLEERGAKVVCARSGERGLVELESLRPDVVVCDIGMPDMDGYEFMRRVRRLAPTAGGGTPAIAVTGYVRTEDKRAAFAAGFQLHVEKPVNVAELADAITRLSGRMPRPSAAASK
ncbi:MAG: ATP-binding protein [Myxococcota bacterium]|nr:ATP-binding protein [Myxococcota bacterium]